MIPKLANFYMLGAADGISSRQYSPPSSPSPSPSPSPAFLYPNLSLIDFLLTCTPTWPYFRVP